MGVAVPEVRHVLAAYEAVADFDVVHDHTIVGPAMASQWGPASGLPPVVTTIHGPLDGELADVYRRIGDRVGLIAISHAQVKPAPDVTIARVIHHGVTASEFPWGDGKGDYFVFLGRLSADKGAHRAIAAAEKAGVTLILAGKVREKSEKEYFEQEVAPHLSDTIRFVGEVPHDEKLRLLSGARATLFPIRWNEPFGLVMIESLACGTPVLAYPEGAAPEVIVDGRTGFLVDGEAEMADAIASVGEIDRHACRAAVEDYFSVDRMVREHIELFDDLVAGRVAQVATQASGRGGSGGSGGDGAPTGRHPTIPTRSPAAGPRSSPDGRRCPPGRAGRRCGCAAPGPPGPGCQVSSSPPPAPSPRRRPSSPPPGPAVSPPGLRPTLRRRPGCRLPR